MFEKKIEITDDNLCIDNKKIQWNDIVGIRRFDSSLFYQMGTGTVFSQILLRGGKTVRIHSNLHLLNIEPLAFEGSYENRLKEYFTVIAIITDKARNLNRRLSRWIEWRFLCPALIIQIMITIYGLFILHKGVFDIADEALLGCIPGFLIGWIWERKARKQLWK